MLTLKIDHQEFLVETGTTIFKACQDVGIMIPHFCYHPALSISGNCRMCLVEMQGHLVASCAMPVTDGMEVQTITPMLQEARKGVLEFLLINHPLECPVCDQGGECDLQNFTMTYGAGSSRFAEQKRAVPNPDFGPLIQTAMTRCIHCTRCIRFSYEIAGVPEIGALGRGEETVITARHAISSELSGNMIDLCPVGALVSKPALYQARPWEVTHTLSIDVSDAVGSPIRIDSRGNRIIRIVPHQGWISDKARFSYDGLRYQRLDQPYIRRDGKLIPSSFEEAFQKIQKALEKTLPDERAAIVGDLADAESMVALKDLMASALETRHIDCRQKPEYLPCSIPFFNLEAINSSSSCLMIGANPRYDAPAINLLLRHRWRQGNFKIELIGKQIDLTYLYDYLGDFSLIPKHVKDPDMVIIGTEAMRHPHAKIFYEGAAKSWNINFLSSYASRMAAFSLGFTQDVLSLLERKKIKFLYLLGADDLDLSEKPFIVYQGHHADRGAQMADVILPGAAYTEKSATYINLEGRRQHTQAVLSPPGNAQEDWRILADLSAFLGHPLPYDNLEKIRKKLNDDLEFLPPQPANPREIQSQKNLSSFYLTNVITRASPTMAKCVQACGGKHESYY